MGREDGRSGEQGAPAAGPETEDDATWATGARPGGQECRPGGHGCQAQGSGVQAWGSGALPLTRGLGCPLPNHRFLPCDTRCLWQTLPRSLPALTLRCDIGTPLCSSLCICPHRGRTIGQGQWSCIWGSWPLGRVGAGHRPAGRTKRRQHELSLSPAWAVAGGRTVLRLQKWDRDPRVPPTVSPTRRSPTPVSILKALGVLQRKKPGHLW